MDGRHDWDVIGHKTEAVNDGELEVGEAAAFAEAGAVAVDRDRAADNGIDMLHLLGRYPATEPFGAADRRCPRLLSAQPLGVKLDEGLFTLEPRHRHVNQLALSQSELPYWQLGIVRIALEHARPLPLGQFRQMLSRLACA